MSSITGRRDRRRGRPAVSPGGFDTFVDGRRKLWASYSAFRAQPANPEAAMAENRVLAITPILSH